MSDPSRDDAPRSGHPRFYHHPPHVEAMSYVNAAPAVQVGAHPAYPTQEHPMRHAWVLLGTETLFLTHQIMAFMQGHNYEVVLEVEIPDEIRGDVMRNRAETGATHFIATAEGDEHVLPALKSGDRTSFRADVWDFFPQKWGDHWPWTQPPMHDGFTVTVKRVVHYRQMDLNLTGRRFEEYLLFGKGDEAHVYHSVLREPDYDHVASLRDVPEWITAEQLQSSVMVSAPELTWHADSTLCSDPLPAGIHPVLFHGIEAYRDPEGQDPAMRVQVPPYSIDVDRTWWFSTRVTNFFPENPCQHLVEVPTPL
jgi:hypothetical protein